MSENTTERAYWNSCRFNPNNQGGHYESYFLRANHPNRPLAFWIRYTLFSPKGRAAETVGELWAIYFDGEASRNTAVRQVVPLVDCQFSYRDLYAQLGQATLSNAICQGKASNSDHLVEWDLSYTGSAPPLLLLPRSFYPRAFPKAKAVVGMPNAIFKGDLTVDGMKVAIDNWVGSLNHNWGTRHTDEYAWGQVAGFDNEPDAFLECITARIGMGPMLLPPLTLAVLRSREAEFALNRLPQALRARGQYDLFTWQFDARTPRVRLRGQIHAAPSAFVGLNYLNPPGGSKTCLNTKLASCELVVERPGQTPRTLIAKNRAAFEILTERHDHGIPVIA